MTAQQYNMRNNFSDTGRKNRLIDFRSDTVTRPSQAMLDAMRTAPLGDDVYGDDPTVNALEEKVATLTGKEAALFLASGTQSNLVAVMSHCARGEEYIIGRDYHIFCNEAGGAAVLGSVVPYPLPTDSCGQITLDDVRAAIKPDDPHCPVSKLLCLENTVSGFIQPQEHIEQLARLAHHNGLLVHLDGARLANAAVAMGKSLSGLSAPADSVSLCLSKGLGAPVGSVLAGSKPFIARARRIRKMLGGGMRQAGILAAAGIYALDHHFDTLAEDHAKAQKLANEICLIEGVSLAHERIDSNMVFVAMNPEKRSDYHQFMEHSGILLGNFTANLRLVCHRDIEWEDIDFMIEVTRKFFHR